MKYEVVFVILHYNSIDSTQKCIESILNLQYSRRPGVVIVDNASPNKTGAVLLQLYKEHENIKVILQEENVGFAKGNNIGYQYAKHKMGAECIICANNDVYFIQEDFLNRVDELCRKCPADVIGPDIRTYHDAHQNPLRAKRLSMQQFRKKHLIKYGWLLYWQMRKVLPFFTIGEKMGAEATKRNIAERNYTDVQDDIVLQGACILFMKGYIEKEEDAFVTDTFMYMEEDLLAYKCLMEGYRMKYLPELYIFHAESLSTAESFHKKVDKEVFYYKECLKSEKILAQYIKTAGQMGKK